MTPAPGKLAAGGGPVHWVAVFVVPIAWTRIREIMALKHFLAGDGHPNGQEVGATGLGHPPQLGCCIRVHA